MSHANVYVLYEFSGLDVLEPKHCMNKCLLRVANVVKGMKGRVKNTYSGEISPTSRIGLQIELFCVFNI